jgi:hypothetical protein
MTVKLHDHAELSQYEILSWFIIQYISGSRNINIDLYKGDKIYACDQYRYKDKWLILHKNIIMEKVSPDHLTFLSLG